jgi:hypothetical protein
VAGSSPTPRADWSVAASIVNKPAPRKSHAVAVIAQALPRVAFGRERRGHGRGGSNHHAILRGGRAGVGDE